MNWKAWLPVSLAIVLGLAAAKLGLDMVRRPGPVGAGKGGATVKVVVAKEAFVPGHAFGEGDLGMVELPSGAAPEGACTDPASLIGRAPVIPVVKDQVILETMLASHDAGTGLATLVPQGMRAVTLEVNEFSGVAGLLVTGCRVDVLGTFTGADPTQMVTRAVAENVKVVAVAQKTGKGEKNESELPKSITLIATPMQAAAIQLAVGTGRVHLILRNGLDDSPSLAQPVTASGIYGVGRKDEQAMAASSAAINTVVPTQPSTGPAFVQTQPWTVDVIRAGLRTTITFAQPDKAAPTTRPSAVAGTDASEK